MSLGGIRNIDNVAPQTFVSLAKSLGINPDMLKSLGRPIVQHALQALRDAGEGAYGPVRESTPYVADDLAEDIAPRLEVLTAFCEGRG